LDEDNAKKKTKDDAQPSFFISFLLFYFHNDVVGEFEIRFFSFFSMDAIPLFCAWEA